MKKDWKSYGNILIAGCLWGTIGIFVKWLEMAGSSAQYTSFLRLGFAFVMLAVLTFLRDGANAFRISRRTLVACILLGVISQGIYNICYSTAVSRIGVSMAAVLLYTSPVFTTLSSMILFKERLTVKKTMGLLINIVGCILTATGGVFAVGDLPLVGIGIGLTAGFCYAMTAVFGRLATDEGSSFAVATYNFLFGALFLGIFTRPWTTVSNPLSGKLILFAILFALIPTATAYIFYFNGVKELKESSKVPVIASVELIVASIFGVLLFGEALGMVNLLGMVMVLVSIVLFA